MKTIPQIAILGLVLAVVMLSGSTDAKLFKKKKWLLFPKLLKLGKPEIEHTYVEHPKIVELIKHVPVVQKVEVIKEVEVIRTVTIPIEVIKEVEIIKTVPIIQEVVKEVRNQSCVSAQTKDSSFLKPEPSLPNPNPSLLQPRTTLEPKN